MSDDWRVRIDIDEEGGAGRLTGTLRELALERDARSRLGDRLVVTRDGPTVFLYAGSEENGREASRVVEGLLGEHELRASVALDRWHPIEERWEDISVAMPDTPGDREREATRRDADEQLESRLEGHAEWEVRIELADHRAAGELAERLQAEGIPLARRWRYLLVGAASEADAGELARRIRAEAPAGTRLEVELSGREMLDSRPWSPFSVFGGMGG